MYKGNTKTSTDYCISGSFNISIDVKDIDSSFWINLQANFDKELSDFEEINQIYSDELEVLKK